MSVLNRKRASGSGQGHVQRAWAAVPARAAVPLARTAGMAVRDGARSAATWATPRVNGARAWTAPRIERGGLAVRDTVAPRIGEVFTATARRVDVTAPDVSAPRRRWPGVVAATAVLAAVGAAVVVLRHRKADKTGGAPGQAGDAGPGLQIARDGQPPSDADGSGADEDASRESPAT